MRRGKLPQLWLRLPRRLGSHEEKRYHLQLPRAGPSTPPPRRFNSQFGKASTNPSRISPRSCIPKKGESNTTILFRSYFIQQAHLRGPALRGQLSSPRDHARSSRALENSRERRKGSLSLSRLVRQFANSRNFARTMIHRELSVFSVLSGIRRFLSLRRAPSRSVAAWLSLSRRSGGGSSVTPPKTAARTGLPLSGLYLLP